MMIKQMMHKIKVGALLSTVLLVSACAGSRSVPMTIQSDPLGGHVVYQVQSSLKGTSDDWVYIGQTPIDIKRTIRNKQLRKAQAFRIKIMKDGYSDQVRDWNGVEFKEEIREKGHVFWNPKLVPSS